MDELGARRSRARWMSGGAFQPSEAAYPDPYDEPLYEDAIYEDAIYEDQLYDDQPGYPAVHPGPAVYFGPTAHRGPGAYASPTDMGRYRGVRGFRPLGAYRRERSTVQFYDPIAMRDRQGGLPSLDEDDEFEPEPRARWGRRFALAALGGGAAALIGGGAYTVVRFFSRGDDVPRTDAASGTAVPAYVDQDQSLMHGQAGIGVRKNTPASGRMYGTPAEAARNAQVQGKTVLPRNDPVRHLASRLTFGPMPTTIADIKKLGINGWIDRQLKPQTIPLTRGEQRLDAELVTYNMTYEQLREQREALAKKGVQADDENVRYAIGKQLFSERQLFETMVDFLNDFMHVAAYHDGNELVRASFDRDVIRKYALGKYVDLFLAANRHPALLNYLDQTRSTKNDVNENLARENLELYTVGAANGYTEKDVRQAAMLQTGRGVADGKYVYRPEQHYVGPIKIMGFAHRNASAEGGEAVQEAYFRYLALHPNTARYLAQNMATRFVSDTPPRSLVDRMAKTYLETKSNLAAVLMTMLKSTEFWGSVGQKVRRPGEYLVATYRALGIQPDTPAGYTAANANMTPLVQGLADIKRKLDEFGHAPMALPTPNGYPDVYVAWTSAGTMVNEWNEAQVAVDGGRRMFTWTKPEQLLGAAPPKTAGAYLDALTRRLINVTLTAAQKKPILAVIKAQSGTPVDATFNGAISAIVRIILATPHHHLR